jgi:uncharacterized protein YjbI with pentapeptide repeats
MTDPRPRSERDEQQEQEKWYEKTRYQILLFAGGIALFILVGGWILNWYIEPKTSGQKKDLVQALGLITAGVAGAIGIYITWRGQSQAREAQDENQRTTQAQLENAQEELRITQQGQITERFTRSIDQLGNKNLEIRLGGIYALQRIANESEDDYEPIVEILTAYIRNYSPRTSNLTLPAADIKATVAVLARLLVRRGHRGEDPLHLVPVELAGTNLKEANFQVINRPVNLERANFQEALLSNAGFGDTNLFYASFERADLREGNLLGANLGSGHLQEADLEHADLRETNLEFADFRNATLREAGLYGANLTQADLRDAVLQGADLRDALFGGTLLQGADLKGADLRDTTHLTQAQLEQASGDLNTRLPPGLKSPAHWGVKSEEQTGED